MRAGLTGLGLVFVATLSASVLFVPDAATPPSEPSEPLAQLGVAPGADKLVAPAAPQPAAPPVSPTVDIAPVVPPPVPDNGSDAAVRPGETPAPPPSDNRQVTI